MVSGTPSRYVLTGRVVVVIRRNGVVSPIASRAIFFFMALIVSRTYICSRDDMLAGCKDSGEICPRDLVSSGWVESGCDPNAPGSSCRRKDERDEKAGRPCRS